MSENKNDEKTIIGSSTVIEGNKGLIVCGGDMEVKGVIKGSIHANGVLALTGSITGDVEANSVSITESGKVIGPIDCKNDLYIERECAVDGDIIAKNAEVHANVQGDLDITAELALSPSSSVIGNISTGSLIVESGAILQGNVSIKKYEKAGLNSAIKKTKSTSKKDEQ